MYSFPVFTTKRYGHFLVSPNSTLSTLHPNPHCQNGRINALDVTECYLIYNNGSYIRIMLLSNGFKWLHTQLRELLNYGIFRNDFTD